jgi:hypothetical protein
MKPLLFIFFFIFYCGLFQSRAQLLIIEHPKVLVDTIPFRFSGSADLKNYSRYREIRIGCYNTGKNDLVFSGAQQSFSNDTSWLKAADNVKFPATIRPGAYGEISILYSTSSPFQRIRILSNSRTGPQTITILDTYKPQVEIKRDMSDYPAKLKEGMPANFASMIVNNSSKTIIVDSAFFPDATLKLVTHFPLTIFSGKSAPLSLMANTNGKMNFYYGGTPVFFFHPENGVEDFVTQEFSCIIIPNIQSLDKDTFNFGNVKRGTVVTNIFHFVNKGSFSLQTGKNTSECVSFDKTEVKPGESFSVTVKYNTSLADSGKITKEFSVLFPPFFYTNSVFLKGVVKGSAIHKEQLLSTEKQSTDYGVISNDTVKTLRRIIRVKNNSGVPLNITNITITSGAYAMSDLKSNVLPGEYFNVKFIYNAKTAGFFDKKIILTVSSGDCSQSEFYYTIEVKGQVITK